VVEKELGFQSMKPGNSFPTDPCNNLICKSLFTPSGEQISVYLTGNFSRSGLHRVILFLVQLDRNEGSNHRKNIVIIIDRSK